MAHDGGLRISVGLAVLLCRALSPCAADRICLGQQLSTHVPHRGGHVSHHGRWSREGPSVARGLPRRARAALRLARGLSPPPRTRVGSMILETSNVFPDSEEGRRFAKSGDVVQLYFTARLPDERVVDSNYGGNPLEFQVGLGTVWEPFDRGVRGLQEGQSRRIRVNCTEFNAYDPNKVRNVPVGSTAELREGLWIELEDGFRGKVLNIGDGYVTVDCNSPLTGHDIIDYDLRLMGFSTSETQSILHFGGGDENEPIEDREKNVQTAVNEIQRMRLIARGWAEEDLKAQKPLLFTGESELTKGLEGEEGARVLSERLGIDLFSEEEDILLIDKRTGKLFRPELSAPASIDE